MRVVYMVALCAVSYTLYHHIYTGDFNRGADNTEVVLYKKGSID